MSFYIGKDDSDNSVAVLTSDIHTIDELKDTDTIKYAPGTILHSAVDTQFVTYFRGRNYVNGSLNSVVEKNIAYSTSIDGMIKNTIAIMHVDKSSGEFCTSIMNKTATYTINNTTGYDIIGFFPNNPLDHNLLTPSFFSGTKAEVSDKYAIKFSPELSMLSSIVNLSTTSDMKTTDNMSLTYAVMVDSVGSGSTSIKLDNAGLSIGDKKLFKLDSNEGTITSPMLVTSNVTITSNVSQCFLDLSDPITYTFSDGSINNTNIPPYSLFIPTLPFTGTDMTIDPEIKIDSTGFMIKSDNTLIGTDYSDVFYINSSNYTNFLHKPLTVMGTSIALPSSIEITSSVQDSVVAGTYEDGSPINLLLTRSYNRNTNSFVSDYYNEVASIGTAFSNLDNVQIDIKLKNGSGTVVMDTSIFTSGKDHSSWKDPFFVMTYASSEDTNTIPLGVNNTRVEFPFGSSTTGAGLVLCFYFVGATIVYSPTVMSKYTNLDAFTSGYVNNALDYTQTSNMGSGDIVSKYASHASSSIVDNSHEILVPFVSDLVGYTFEFSIKALVKSEEYDTIVPSTPSTNFSDRYIYYNTYDIGNYYTIPAEQAASTELSSFLGSSYTNSYIFNNGDKISLELYYRTETISGKDGIDGFAVPIRFRSSDSSSWYYRYVVPAAMSSRGYEVVAGGSYTGSGVFNAYVDFQNTNPRFGVAMLSDSSDTLNLSLANAEIAFNNASSIIFLGSSIVGSVYIPDITVASSMLYAKEIYINLSGSVWDLGYRLHWILVGNKV
jgi:hypothetical protein